MFWFLVLGLLIAVSGLAVPAALAAASAPARPITATAAAAQLFDLVNSERAAAGLSSLEWRDDVASIAIAWTGQMAATGSLSHNDLYFSPATQAAIGSSARGENVAFSGSVEAIHYAFMHSPGHLANILNPDFTQGGFGVVQDAARTWWATEDFLRPSAAEPPGPTPPSAAPVDEAVVSQPAVTEPHGAIHPIPPPATTAPTTVPADPTHTAAPTRTSTPDQDADRSPALTAGTSTAGTTTTLPIAAVAGAGAFVIIDGLGLLMARRWLNTKPRLGHHVPVYAPRS